MSNFFLMHVIDSKQNLFYNIRCLLLWKDLNFNYSIKQFSSFKQLCSYIIISIVLQYFINRHYICMWTFLKNWKFRKHELWKSRISVKFEFVYLFYCALNILPDSSCSFHLSKCTFSQQVSKFKNFINILYFF